MTFVIDQLVADVHEQFSAIHPIQVCAEFGNLEKAKAADTPRIVWTLTGGQFGPSTKIGGPDGAMAQAIPNFFVWLWFEELEQCWNAMADMLSAIRATAYGPNVSFVNFQVPTQIEGRNMDKGQVIVLTVTLSIPMRTDGTVEAVLVELQSHQSTVTEDAGPDEDGNPTDPFETVLVVGPIN